MRKISGLEVAEIISYQKLLIITISIKIHALTMKQELMICRR